MLSPASARRPAGPPALLARGRSDGIGRSTSRAAERISDDLRRGDGRLLARRRAVAGLSLVAVGAMSAVSLYQMGILKHLSDPPLPSMNSDKVDASGEAYVLGSTPDSTLASPAMR